ncbi:O-acetyl-ADP-ribose deacetylase [Pontibacter sp. H249]|uniref:O-acetyl-ADP-ribose deacetylase n=1 Tax=Pontibacter sp. H249 TaxID=3133420 RepID=UPI0030C10872
MEGPKLEVIKGDITKQEVDTIVNAANTSLLGGGGVDGAIHRAGGPAILEECKQIRAKQGGCPTGEAVITTAGKLPAKYVIHTVGPVWQGGNQNEPELLASCYSNSLRLAIENDVKSIALPNISTGVYGYPKAKAAEVAVRATNEFLQQHASSLESIIFVCFDDENFMLYEELLKK